MNMSITYLRVLSAQLQVHYDEMAATFSSFQNKTGLTCLSGCGACCLQPTIEASPFEMLPIALELFDQGQADETLERLSNHQSPTCFFYRSHSTDGTKGQCGIYTHRPSLCRIFAVGALPDKSHTTKLSICRLIKLEHRQKMSDINPVDAPRIDHWKQKSQLLADELSNQDMPINQALKLALEKVTMLAYYETLQDQVGENQQVG